MNTRIFKKAVNITTLLSFFLWNLALAAPQGGQVAAGSAAISQSGTQTVINQTSQSAVINWNSFNTASNEAVQFNQPNSSAIALNRINSGLPTQFAGSLTANGQVWILNPAGVVFTGSSNINVAGLLVSTHSIKNSDFMSGNYNFSSVPGYANSKIKNYGNITVADMGMVALVAPGVENYGIIQANLGKVALASGKAFVLDLNGDGLINFGNSAPVQNGYVSNAGKIIANGGKVYLTAHSAAQMVNNVINMSGVIEAKTVHSSHGTIILNGGSAGRVKISGKLDASDGGFIETSGYDLDITDAAIINVGQGGTWSLDPWNLYIDACLAAIISGNLSAGANVFQYATHNLYVNSAITSDYSGFVKLILGAGNEVKINAPITMGGYGSLKIFAPKIKINAPLDLGGYLRASAWGQGIYINTDMITTGWSQTYNGHVKLETSTTLTSTNGDIKFMQAVDNSWWADPVDLTINVLNGKVKFYDYVGDWNPLNSLTVNGMTEFKGGYAEVITYGSQLYNGLVKLRADTLLLTIQSGAIFLLQGVDGFCNQLVLITGADSDYIGGGIFGDNINVYGLVLGGSGSADLTNTTINGFSGADAFAQVVLVDATGNHYCVNGVGVGSCGAIILPTDVVNAEIFNVPVNAASDAGKGWSMTIIDSNGNTEVCNQNGCVVQVTKTPR